MPPSPLSSAEGRITCIGLEIKIFNSERAGAPPWLAGRTRPAAVAIAGIHDDSLVIWTKRPLIFFDLGEYIPKFRAWRMAADAAVESVMGAWLRCCVVMTKPRIVLKSFLRVRLKTWLRTWLRMHRAWLRDPGPVEGRVVEIGFGCIERSYEIWSELKRQLREAVLGVVIVFVEDVV